MAETNLWNYFLLKLQCIRGMFWKIAREANDVMQHVLPLILISPSLAWLARDTNLHSTSIITLEILALSQQVSQRPPARWTLSGGGSGVRSDVLQPSVYITFTQNSFKVRQRIPLNSAPVYPVFVRLLTCLFTAQT